MYKLLYKCYFSLMRSRKKRIQLGKKDIYIQKRFCDRIEWIFNCVLTKYYLREQKSSLGVTKNKRSQQIIVSLTSFPKRIDTVWITIETLMRQTVKPDRIILWLAKTQFQSIDSLPERLIGLQKRGLEIRFCDDLKSHKKYFYVMQEYPNDLIVLTDDDMFYPADTIAELLKMHKKYPADICTMTAQVMDCDRSSLPSQWRNPRVGEIFEHSTDIQIFTGSGSLYPPGAVSNLAFDKERMKSICLFADDLWLTFMALINGTKITTSRKWRAFPITIYGTSTDSLWYINGQDGQNDVQWGALLTAYKEEYIKWISS